MRASLCLSLLSVASFGGAGSQDERDVEDRYAEVREWSRPKRIRSDRLPDPVKDFVVLESSVTVSPLSVLTEPVRKDGGLLGSEYRMISYSVTVVLYDNPVVPHGRSVRRASGYEFRAADSTEPIQFRVSVKTPDDADDSPELELDRSTHDRFITIETLRDDWGLTNTASDLVVRVSR